MSVFVFVLVCCLSLVSAAVETCTGSTCEARLITSDPAPIYFSADVASSDGTPYYFIASAAAPQSGVYRVSGTMSATYNGLEVYLFERLDSNPFCLFSVGNKGVSPDLVVGSLLDPVAHQDFNVSIAKSFQAGAALCVRVTLFGGRSLSVRLTLARSDCAVNSDCGSRCSATEFMEGYCPASANKCEYAVREAASCPASAATKFFSTQGYVILAFSIFGALLVSAAATVLVVCLVMKRRKASNVQLSAYP